ncbi:phosphotransferase [Microbacterium karelineae]|uniref:phosphotransferase n=1 Tax=Microbacterium karelineae TaxID=2654283 RepID=UPI0012EA4FE7|nr:phosphotransferase [Microbacterium karelineae]
MHDPALPGLGTILGLESSYLRYKPGTSAVAGLRVGDRAAQAVAYPVGVHEKLAGLARRARATGDLIRVDHGLGVAIVAAPADRDLPGIRAALERHPDAETLVYKPGRRWVARCVACRVIVKVHTPERAAEALRAHDAVGPLLPTAEVVFRDPQGVVETRLLDGRPARGDADARATGAVIARLHAAPAPIADVRDHLPGADGIAAILPDLAPRAERLARGIASALAGRPMTAPIHGDLSADQVIVAPGGAHLIDLDRAGVGDPMADLGSWAADEISRGVPRASAGAALREGYARAGGTVDEAALYAQTAAGLLRRGAEPFRRRDEGWRGECARLLDEAQALLALAGVRSDTALPGASEAVAEAEVVAHRPGRRAVLRTADGFVKLTRRSRFSGVADRAERVTALRTLRSPRVLARDDRAATLRLSAVGARTLLEAGPTLSEADLRAVWTRVGEGIAELSDLDPAGLPEHGVAEELGAIERAHAHGLLDVAAAYERVAAGLIRAAGPRGVLHRDLHDKQILLPADGIDPIGLIDVDTLAIGEKALDAANLLVHLELRELQGLMPGERARAAAEALRRGLGGGSVWDRVPAYADATRLRLAGVYAARDGWGEVAATLLARVG